MTEHDQHASPIQTPKQLVIVVVLAFVVPIALILLIAQLVTGGMRSAGTEAQVLARIAPVGTVRLAAPSGPKGMLAGEQVYAQVCKTCHEGGLAGAHKLGDKAAWAKVIAQGEKLTVQHAIAGLRAMPARGGNPDLTDAEVQRAVAWMANQAGATWKPAPIETAPATTTAAALPAAPMTVAAAAAPVANAAAAAASATAPVAKAVPMSAAPPVSVAAAAPAAIKVDGKKVYDTACALCHGAGIAGAPKVGDKAQWNARIAQGNATLYDHAIKGFQGKAGLMPAKGGNTSLSDADVKAAVDMMVAASK